MKKIFPGIALLFAATLLLSGCAINRSTADVNPTADFTRIKSMHVNKHAKDDRDVNLMIAKKLENMGYKVTTSLDATSDADALVTYIDKWMWDITVYMLELTVTIRDPKTNFPLASGNSYHTSITRISPQEMVNEVIDNIFKQEAASRKK
jgi:uncharacterized lipoprotein YajG